MTTTQADMTAAIDYFLSLAEIEENEMTKFQYESSPWQFHRDRFISFSNTAAQLMGEKDANPFV